MDLLTDFTESKEGLTMVRTMALTSNGWLNTYFIIDTGTSTSLFSPEVGKIKMHYDDITEFSGITLTAKRCTAVLSFADQIIKFEGNIIDYDTLPKIGGKHLSGILGTDFLVRNRLVLDFYNGGIYIKEPWETNTNSCSYISMKLGLNDYYIPTIMLNSYNCQFSFVVDTGATNNMIAPTISYRGKKIKGSRPYVVNELAGSHLANECEMKFYIQMSYNGMLFKREFIDVFTFAQYEYNAGQSVIFKTLHGLIGNGFIHQQKWIIDFTSMRIYEKIE